MPETVETLDQTQAQQSDEHYEAQPVQYPQALDNPSAEPAGNLDILLDMPMTVSVSLGTTEIPIHRLLQLAPGSVVQLDRLIDEPADLYVRDIKFATGEIVVVEGHFAIKIKQIIGTDSANQ